MNPDRRKIFPDLDMGEYELAECQARLIVIA
jgi:hypothetical protein